MFLEKRRVYELEYQKHHHIKQIHPAGIGRNRQ